MRKSKRIITKLMATILIAGGLCLSPNSNANTTENSCCSTSWAVVCLDGCINNYSDVGNLELISCFQACEDFIVVCCY